MRKAFTLLVAAAIGFTVIHMASAILAGLSAVETGEIVL